MLAHGAAGAYAPAPSTESPTQPGPSGVIPIVFAPEFQGGSPIPLLLTSLLPYIHSGDSVMLSSGASVSQSKPDDAQLNRYLAELQPRLPSGVTYEARTGGLANAQILADGVSHGFASLVYDYEPGFEPEFTFNFTRTLEAFANFSGIAHGAGFSAIGYPLSAPAWHTNSSAYGWNYGELATTTGVNRLQTQLQGAAHHGDGKWDAGVQELVSQYAGYDLSPSALSVQLTLATGNPNNITVATATADYEYAVQQGVGQVVLWFNAGSVAYALQFLESIRG
jgi:hypothetical protein